MPRISSGQVKSFLSWLMSDRPNDVELARIVIGLMKYLEPARRGAPKRWDDFALLHLRYLVSFYEQRGLTASDTYKMFSEGNVGPRNKKRPKEAIPLEQLRDLDGKAKRLIKTDAGAQAMWVFFGDRLASEAARKKGEGVSSRARGPLSLDKARAKFSALF